VAPAGFRGRWLSPVRSGTEAILCCTRLCLKAYGRPACGS
jgi:hypothetical protein